MERSEPTESGSMTIDELARQAGITTRNVRAYQSRGLLPPPQIVGRVAFYGEGHLARLRYIAHLQNVGFSLAGIYHLLEAWEHGRSIADVLGLEQAITAPWSDEVPERYTAGRLHEMFPALAEDPALMERALELGVIAADGEDYVAASPRLIQVGMELVSAGIPVGAVLDAHAELAADTDRMARRFIKLFDTWVWRPFVEEGLPAERLEGIVEIMQRLRPTTLVSVQIALMASMEKAVAASINEDMNKLLSPDAAAS